jgi:hypothetical protein
MKDLRNLTEKKESTGEIDEKSIDPTTPWGLLK